MDTPPLTHLELAARTPFELALAAETGSSLNSWTSTALLAAGTALAVFVLLRSLRKRAARQRASGTPRERIDRIQTEAAARRLTESYSADAVELTERLAAVLDAKAAAIEKLLEDADRAVARLKRHVASARSTPQSLVADPETDPSHRQIHELADQGLGPIQIARTLNKPIGQVELVLALRNR